MTMRRIPYSAARPSTLGMDWRDDGELAQLSQSEEEEKLRQEEFMKKQPDLFSQPKSIPKPKIITKTLKELYTEWAIPAIDSIKSNLESCYGENYEFTVHKSSTFLQWLTANDKGNEKANMEFLKRCIKRVEGYDYNRVRAYTIVIRFPELTVKNSRGGKTRMTDMFIKMELSAFLNDSRGSTLFYGMRTSYTLAEFSSSYNFSHCHGSPESFSWDYFCLGDTKFSTLCRSLAVEFDPNMFGLFLYQLPEYLSWESLEGGPYKYISNINERGAARSVNISSTICGHYYRAYLALGHKPNFQLKSNPYYYKLELVEDDEMRNAITSVVTNTEHLQNWDVTRKISMDSTIDNRKVIIDSYMKRNAGVKFTFKGQPIEFQITDATKKEEKDNNIKVAHNQIRQYIIGQLNQSINLNIENEFSKKRRVYTPR